MKKTRITFLAKLSTVSMDLIQQVISRAGITDLTVTDVVSVANVLTVTANRQTTDAEKTAIMAAISAIFPIIEDVADE